MRLTYKRIAICINIFLLALVMSSIVFGKEIELTEEEKEYIRENSIVITGVDPEFSPYEFIDIDGEYKGIAADYLKLIEIRTGLSFHVQKELTWTQTYDLALEGKIDVLPSIGITNQRKEHFLFTQPYLSFQRVILSHVDSITYTNEDLANLRVGVQRNSSHSSFLSNDTKVKPIYYNNNDELLLALSYGEIDVAVTNYASSRYRIKELGITDIKIDYIYKDSTNELGIAVNMEKPILHSIINKALNSITKEERITIANKWLGIEQSIDYRDIVTKILAGIVLIVLFFLIFIYWTYKLKREIKHRRQVEQQLVEAKLEAINANEAKSIFLARMSHEIRTPLNAIIGLSYLLGNTKASNIQLNYIKNLKDSSYNLLNLINDILDFSKIEAGEIKTEHIGFSLDHLLEKVSSLFMPKSIEKGLYLHVKKDVKILDRIIGDPTRLEQILINLINNSIKFTSTGGVTIDVNLLSKDSDRYMIRFCVTDTGIGIKEEQIQNLFTPFHQLDSTITREYGGTGLGLSICKHLSELLGGKIYATSKYGEGSTFCLELPFEVENEQLQENFQKYYPDFSGYNVLVVEPDRYSCEVIEDYLKSYHMNVDLVHNAQDALTMLDKEGSNYSLVITELNLPVMTGFELIERTRSNNLKYIIMAEQIKESGHEIAEELGVRHIIMKPIIASILYNSIIQCLEVENQTVIIAETLTETLVGHNVLLVEDNEVNQLIENEILSQRGYSVQIANNGLEAVEIMKKPNAIHIILMDIHMPIMDGYEATRNIRLFNQEIPILAMTAVSFSNIQDKCSEVGIDGYVTKPVEPENLFEVIERYVKNSKKSNNSKIVTFEDKIDHCDDDQYLDIQQGLKRIGNNKKLYFEVIERFLLDIQDTGSEIELLVQNHDYTNAEKLVHKVKGTSGNVGAVKLFASSRTLLDVLNSKLEEDIGPYLWEFESDLLGTQKVLKCILSKLEEPVIESKQIYQFTREIESKLVHLANLLNNADLDAIGVFEEIHTKIPLSDPSWVKVEEYIKGYQFKKAYDTLATFLKL